MMAETMGVDKVVFARFMRLKTRHMAKLGRQISNSKFLEELLGEFEKGKGVLS